MKVLNALPKYLGNLSGVSIFLIMVLTSVDVVLRYFFNSPLIWVLEWTEYLMVVIVYFGLAYTYTVGGHIGIDILLPYFPQTIRHILNLFNHVLMFALVVLMTWQGWVLFEDSWRLGRRHMGAGHTPEFPADLALFIGCAVFSLLLLTRIISIIRDLTEARSERK
jgi:TRAP-type C4-dicarboxylate transport system permease small subunit